MNNEATPREFTIDQAREYAYERGKNTRFFYNVYGYYFYFTLKPTFATPTGKLKRYPRSVIFNAGKR